MSQNECRRWCAGGHDAGEPCVTAVVRWDGLAGALSGWCGVYLAAGPDVDEHIAVVTPGGAVPLSPADAGGLAATLVSLVGARAPGGPGSDVVLRMLAGDGLSVLEQRALVTVVLAARRVVLVGRTAADGGSDLPVELARVLSDLGSSLGSLAVLPTGLGTNCPNQTR
jgi:hypothetical protein